MRSIAIINVPGITIRNDWSQIISVGGSLSLFRSHLSPRVPLFPVMHGLGLEQTLDLVRDGIVGIIAEIGGYFIGACQK